MASLEGRTAFVTGGANGIGRACVERLQDAGRAVAFCDIEIEAGRDVATALADSPATVEFLPCDVTSEEQVGETVRTGARALRSARYRRRERGVDRPLDAATMTEEEWDAFLAVNMKSVWLWGQARAPGMRERRRGSISPITSIHAFVTSRGKFPYAGAKSASPG